VLQVQFHDIKGNDIEQFRTMATQTLLMPPEYNSGSVVYPYEKAR
jgi:branched-chain amino acid transport system substrate-binding protein